MKMNSKTAGIFFLFVCLLIVLFIGQWSNSRGSNAYLGQMENFTEGARTNRPKAAVGSTKAQATKKPMNIGAAKPFQTTKKTERFSNVESFKEGGKARPRISRRK